MRKKEVQDFFVYLIVVDLINWPLFHFVGVVGVAMNQIIDKIVGLAINKAISIGEKVAISFFKLFLQQIIMSF